MSSECHKTPLMTSQHWFRYWLRAVRQQAITRSNVDPDICHHMVSLDHNGLTQGGLDIINVLGQYDLMYLAYHLIGDKPLPKPTIVTNLWKMVPQLIYLVVVASFISDRIQQWYRNRKTFCKYQYSHDIETLLHSAGGHQGSRKAQADNQNYNLYLLYATANKVCPRWPFCHRPCTNIIAPNQ